MDWSAQEKSAIFSSEDLELSKPGSSSHCYICRIRKCLKFCLLNYMSRVFLYSQINAWEDVFKSNVLQLKFNF